MQKKELTARLAKAARVSPGVAADELDGVIHDFLTNLRRKDPPRPNALERLIQEANCAPEEKGRHAKS